MAMVAARCGSVGPCGAGQGPSPLPMLSSSSACLQVRAMLIAEDPGDVPCCPGSLSSRSTCPLCSSQDRVFTLSWSEAWGRVTYPGWGHPMSIGREDPCCVPLSPKEPGSLNLALLG